MRYLYTVWKSWKKFPKFLFFFFLVKIFRETIVSLFHENFFKRVCKILIFPHCALRCHHATRIITYWFHVRWLEIKFKCIFFKHPLSNLLHNAKNLLQGWIELFFPCKNLMFFFFVTKEIKNDHNVTHDSVFAFGYGLGSKAHSYIAAGKK